MNTSDVQKFTHVKDPRLTTRILYYRYDITLSI